MPLHQSASRLVSGNDVGDTISEDLKCKRKFIAHGIWGPRNFFRSFVFVPDFDRDFDHT
jgi:hypothetical protein